MANAFSEMYPNVQLAWDASSLKSFQFCPRHYQYANLEGWQNPSVDLAFGRLIASALERYQKMRLDGSTKDEALLEVVKWAMKETYDEVKGTQWGGSYADMWKCDGTKKYKNAKGNAAKCPNAFERVWFPGPPPHICGNCGSSIRTDRLYQPDDGKKHRHSLLSAIIAYVDDQPEVLTDGLHPYRFPDGTAAVELSGRLPLPLYTSAGEQFLVTWNFDYIGVFGGNKYPVDNKTTTKGLDDKFFASYSVDTQFDTYDLVASIAYPDAGISGVMIDAISITATTINFGRREYHKTEAMREEHFYDLQWWIRQAEDAAMKGYWPMNKRNCWICPFKGVCSQDPSLRQGYLKSNFQKQERWNPLLER